MEKRILLMGVSLLFIILFYGAAEAGELIPRTVFEKPERIVIRDCDRWDLLVVKFREGTGVRLGESGFTAPNGIDLRGFSGVMRDYGDVRTARLFSRPESELWNEKIRGELRTGRELADLNLYYAFGAGSREEAEELANRLNRLPIIELVYPEPYVELAGIWGKDILTPDFVPQQDYLEASPTGVDAYASWEYADEGSKGENVKMIDVELAWNWDHEDLTEPFFTGGTPSMGSEPHGTAVMGEIRGSENGYGITGITPLAEVGGVAIDIDDWPDNVAAWFNMASANLDEGDVWLIELHGPGPIGDYVCMEWWQANYDAIAASTANGRICVEAGGNGSTDFDDPVYEGKFDRDVRDSLAIIVGAGTPYEMQPEWFTNYGSRMDANGWGSEIVTTGYGDLYGDNINNYYTADFGGTSGASPMVVGVCVAIQSRYKALTNGEVLTPLQIREVIKETGVEPPDPDQYIGPRPNLAAVMEHEIFDVEGVHLDDDIYNCDDVLEISVMDEEAGPSVDVMVESLTEPDGETVVMYENEPGKYEGSFPIQDIPPVTGDGVLSVVDMDTVTAYYLPLASQASAVTDCLAPAISDVLISDVTAESALVSWTTDEPADSVVKYGIGTPAETAQSSGLEVSHEIILENLEDCACYSVQIESTDEAGNTAVDDNSGEYYRFTTLQLVTFFTEGAEQGQGEWTVEGLWHIVEPASPCSKYHSGSRSWYYGQESTCDYDTGTHNFGCLTSGLIDLTGTYVAQLTLWHWLETENVSSYDTGTIEIKANGQPLFTELGSYRSTGGSWSQLEFDISEYAGNDVILRFCFDTQDDYYNDYAGWYVDDIMISITVPCTTPTPSVIPTEIASLTPTPTCSPTNTPSASPTCSPTSTPSPSPSPTLTPTQIPTDTPTVFFTPTHIPTVAPTCTPIDALGVRLDLSYEMFHPGLTFNLDAYLTNPGPATYQNIRLAVVLDVYDLYFWHPSWTPEFDCESIDIEVEAIRKNILNFIWPDTGNDQMNGLVFYGALLNESMAEILGEFGTAVFGYGPP